MGDMSIYLVQIESGKTIRVTIPNVARHAEDRITGMKQSICPGMRKVPSC